MVKPQGGLRGRVLALSGDRLEPLEVRQPGQPGQTQREHAHGHEREQPVQATVGAEEDRDAHDREELADRAGGHDEPPERPAEHVVVPEDRQQRPQCGRGQRQGDRDEGVHEAGGSEQTGDHDRDHGADQPAGHGQPSGPLPEVVRARARSRRAGTGNPDPTLATSTIESGSANPATSGPISTPPTISTTTCGTRNRARSAHTNGAAAEMTETTSSARRPVSRSMAHPAHGRGRTVPRTVIRRRSVRRTGALGVLGTSLTGPPAMPCRRSARRSSPCRGPGTGRWPRRRVRWAGSRRPSGRRPAAH